MGLFNLFDPVFQAVDAWLGGVLPPVARLVFWGVVGALVSMGLYWLLSPQKMIGELKQHIQGARWALDAHDGDFGEALPLMRAALAPAVKQVMVILGPAVAASLPLLFLLGWLYSAYGYRFREPYTATALHVVPARYQAHWAEGAQGPVIVVSDRAGRRVAGITMRVALPDVGRRQWWSVFFGDPNGYLPDGGPLDRIAVGVQPKTYLGFGPGWLRGWEAVFCTTLVMVSLLVKLVFRIR